MLVIVLNDFLKKESTKLNYSQSAGINILQTLLIYFLIASRKSHIVYTRNTILKPKQ